MSGQAERDFRLSYSVFEKTIENYQDIENTLEQERETQLENIATMTEQWHGITAETLRAEGIHFFENGQYETVCNKITKMRGCLEGYMPQINKLRARCSGFVEQLQSDDYVEPFPGDVLRCGDVLSINYGQVAQITKMCDEIIAENEAITDGMADIIRKCSDLISGTDERLERLYAASRKVNRINNYKYSLELYEWGMRELEANMAIDFAMIAGCGKESRFRKPDNAIKCVENSEFNILCLTKKECCNSKSLKDIDYNVIEEFERTYGFTEEEAFLLYEAIEKLGESCSYERDTAAYINYVYGTLSALCISYDAKRWRMTASTPNLADAKERLDEAGLSSQQILDLQVLINLQHGDFSDETLCKKGIDIKKSTFCNETHADMMDRCADKNNDFSHQTIQIAAFASEDMMLKEYHILPGTWIIGLFNSPDLQHSYTKYEISFKGDIDSGRYSEADFQSDVDAINIYNRMRKDTGASLNKIWTEYYGEIESGDTNRAEEFFCNLGNGEVGIGIIELDYILKRETIGSTYIQSGNDMSKEDIDKANSIFVQWIFSEYYGYEYEFPE